MAQVSLVAVPEEKAKEAVEDVQVLESCHAHCKVCAEYLEARR